MELFFLCGPLRTWRFNQMQLETAGSQRKGNRSAAVVILSVCSVATFFFNPKSEIENPKSFVVSLWLHFFFCGIYQIGGSDVSGLGFGWLLAVLGFVAGGEGGFQVGMANKALRIGTVVLFAPVAFALELGG